jgi:hypothetical protein
MLAARDNLPTKQPFVFETIERGVQGAARNTAAGFRFELRGDTDAGCVRAKAENREQDELFEFAQVGRCL